MQKNKKKTIPKYGEQFNPYKIDTFALAYNCILQQPQAIMKDADKMLLIKLCQYRGKNGKAYPTRKTLTKDLGWSLSKVDKTIASLKRSFLIDTEKTGCHSSSEFIFFYHEIYDSANTKKESKSKKIHKEISLKPETRELIEYWNSFEDLTTHKLEGKQTKTVRNLDSAIHKLLQGTCYTDCEDVQTGAKKKLTIKQIKKAIDRMAVASGPDYYEGTQRMSFLNFVHNPRMTLGTGKERYRHKYPLLHFLSNEPKPLSQKYTKKNTEYKTLVDRLIQKMTGSKPENMDSTVYNKVVRYFEKAATMMETFKPTGQNETTKSLIRRIPDLIYDSLEECGKGNGIGQLGLAVSNLEEMMKRRLIIK